jgi:A/G-specific adenine glycosylase
MKGRAGHRPAGENEMRERRELGLERVDQPLESFDVGFLHRGLGHSRGDHAGRIGETGAEREEVPLNLDERLRDVLARVAAAREDRPNLAKRGVQLVDFAVRVHPGIVFRHACAAEQRSLARVPCSRVDFHSLLSLDGRAINYMTAKRTRKADGRGVTPAIPLSRDRRRFRDRLLAWYRRHGRDLPWRRTSDPYHILVSEIMLQQTQVDRVLPKYREWLDKYPSLEALAGAPEQEVRDTWYPLGYNVRPRRLQAIARESVARYGGRLPADREVLLSFKGIGAYTAGAIRSFAFRERAAILDTNVARVLFRVFIAEGDQKSHAMKRHLWQLSETLVPIRHAFDFNQALMDLGAMVCVARNPKCLICPMRKGCRAYPFDPTRA